MPPVTTVTPVRLERLGEGGGVVDDAPGVGRELRLRGLVQGDRLGGHDVRQRPAEHERAAAVDGVGELGVAQHQAAARAAQGLVRGRGHDVGVADRVEVAGEDLAGDEPGEVRHVDHERRADLVGDLAEDAEVDLARIGAVAGDQQQRPLLARALAHLVVVEQVGLRVDAVGGVLEELAGDVGAKAVGEVAAGVERHAHHLLVAELAAQRLPVLGGEVAHVLRAQALELGRSTRWVRTAQNATRLASMPLCGWT